MPILLAMAASFGWGCGDFLGGLASRKQSQAQSYASVTFWRCLFEVIMFAPVVLIVPGFPHPVDMVWGLVGGAFAAATVPLFFKALGDGHMGTVASVSGTVAAAVPVIVGLAMGERPRPLQLVGVAAALVSIATISVGRAEQHERSEHVSLSRHLTRRDIRYATFCGLGFGGYFVAMHQTSTGSGLWPALGVNVVTVLGVGTVLMTAGVTPRLRRDVLAINALGAACEGTAGLLYLVATRAGYLSMVGVVSSTYPVMTVVLASVVFGERLSRMHKVGLGAAIASFALIGAG